MIVRPFKRTDIDMFVLQGVQECHRANLEALEEGCGHMSIARESDDRALTIFGIIPIWEGRGYVWSFIDAEAGNYLMRILSLGIQSLNDSGYVRLEADVAADFDNGHRFMKLLGFREAWHAEAYYADGSDAVIYERVRR